MKGWTLLLLLLYPFIELAAQEQQVAGYANSIQLKEENGFPGHVYYTLQTAPGGKIYSQTYNGEFFVSGNNYYKRIDSLSRLPGGVGRFHFLSATESWFFNSRSIALLHNDSVIKVVEWQDNRENCYALADLGIIYLKPKVEGTELFVFDGKNISSQKFFPGLIISMDNSFVQDKKLDLWRFENKDGKLHLFKFSSSTLSFVWKASYPFPHAVFIRSLTDETHFIVSAIKEAHVYQVWNGKVNRLPFDHTCGVAGKACIDWESHPFFVRQASNGVAEYLESNSGLAKTAFLTKTADAVTKIKEIGKGEAFLGFTNNKPLRISTYLKHFPKVLNQSGADIFAITEDSSGNLWAGSYKGGIAVLENNKVKKVMEKGAGFLNGSLSEKGFQYFIREYPDGGLIQYNSAYQSKKLTPVLGYYVYADRRKEYLYYGTSNYNGILRARFSDLEAGQPVWEKIDSSRGIYLHNIITITEDKLGRIWAGHPRRGISLYDPHTGMAKTWLSEKKETAFGAYSSLLTADGTVWIGTNADGLWYYDDYKKPAHPSSFKKVTHPLFETGKPISGLTVYKNWLVLAATDRVLLLNLDSFQLAKKVIVRYLNPGEHGFTGVTEQNAILVSKKDSTVWFSNTDMLYQWDIRKWLSLPTYAAKLEIELSSDTINRRLGEAGLELESHLTSFGLTINYSSPDLLPRYISAALLKRGDSIVLPPPSLTSAVSIFNIAQGDYEFVVDVYDTDGQSRRYIYPLTLRKYLWQRWWFWVVLSSVAFSALLFLFNQKGKRELAEARIRQKEAEWNSFKAGQEKRISQLQLASLINQFRPHFILNALNTIGAQMDDKPETETVLSRLGESVNIIFNHAKNQKILHSFESEWALVNNIIEIHRIMYLKELATELPIASELSALQQQQVPLGIFQIPVENALLHGLNNREEGPWILSISVSHTKEWIRIIITDNGVGRKKSAHLSNSTKHGTGTRNSSEMISILNQRINKKISITYEDDIFPTVPEKSGTRVIIEIPTNLSIENE